MFRTDLSSGVESTRSLTQSRQPLAAAQCSARVVLVAFSRAGMSDLDCASHSSQRSTFSRPNLQEKAELSVKLAAYIPASRKCSVTETCYLASSKYLVSYRDACKLNQNFIVSDHATVTVQFRFSSKKTQIHNEYM